MTRMTGPDCVVMCNLIDTHTHTHNFTHVLEGDKPVHHFPRFRPHIFPGQSVVVDVEGVGFRPRAVVVKRGVVAVCTRIYSQK